MPDFPRLPDLQAIARDEILARSTLLSKDAADRDGTDLNVLLAAIAALADEVISQLAYVAAGVYLDSSVGVQLDRIAFDHFGLRRKSAAGSLGSATFSLPAPSPSTFTVPDGTLLQALDGNQFLVIGNNVFNVGLSSMTVPIRSALAGSGQNERSGQITAILGAVAGAPAGLVVTNALATAGAADDESDADLRNRCRTFFTSARRGTLAAIEAGALATQGVVRAQAIEVLDSLGRPARMVLLMIADQYTDQFASFDTVPPTYQAQSQQLAAAVAAGLNEYRAAGIYVQVQVAQVILQAITLSLTFIAGADVDYTATLAKAAVVNYVNGLRPGDDFDPVALQQVLATVPGLQLTGHEIISPVGVVAAKPLQAIRTSFGLVYAASAMGASQPVLVGTSPDPYIRPVI